MKEPVKKLLAAAGRLSALVRRPVPARSFVISFAATFGGLFALWTLLVFWVDPYIYYHRGWGLKNVYSNSRARIPGIMRNFDYDAVLFGSSMCQNFRCSEIDAALRTRSIKATSAGLTSGTLSRYFETARRCRGRKLTRCVMGIDIFGFGKPDDDLRYLYLYEDRWFPCEYFYSADTAEAVADVFVTNISAPFNRISRHQLDRDLMFANKPRAKYGRQILEKEVRRLKTGPVMPDGETVQRFEKHLFSHVRKHPEIRFDLFLPPYSIYFWCLLREQGKLETYLKMRDLFARMAAAYPNVRVHDFQAEFDIVCRLDLYQDVTHYSPAVNTRMIKEIGEGRVVFPAAEFRRRTAAIERRSAEFQTAFDKLRSKAR